jgi:tripartite-type tricarboxylate transporter receptor subunit TctC
MGPRFRGEDSNEVSDFTNNKASSANKRWSCMMSPKFATKCAELSRTSMSSLIKSILTRSPKPHAESTMKVQRRKFLQLAASGGALLARPYVARAQAYPTQPVRIIAGFPPGGPSDLLARLMGQYLSERLGQPFIVENRPGAASNLATETVARAPADGHTLLVAVTTNAINATLYDNLKFDFVRDIAPISGLIRFATLMEVNPAFPAKTLREFIAYAKTHPGEINMASAGPGSIQHVCGELFKIMAGVDLVHVSYRGVPPALADLMGGRVHVTFDPIPSSIEYVRTGKLRALAVSTATRSELLPDVPTVGEIVPGYEASAWNGLAAPRNTPAPIIERLNREINAGLADPKIKAQLANLGGTVIAGSSADFSTFIAAEVEKWGKVVKAAGIKPE